MAEIHDLKRRSWSLCNSSNPANTYLTRFVQVIYLGIEEIVGCDRFQEVFLGPIKSQLESGDSSDDGGRGLSLEHAMQLQTQLEKVYGPVAGRGMAIRSGRAGFRYLLRGSGEELGYTDMDFKLLPLKERIRVGLDTLAGFINREMGQCIQVTGNSDDIFWTMENYPAPVSGQDHRSICHLVLGLLQETLSWVSAGKTYSVEEIHCRDQGFPTCTLRIHLQPLA